MKGKLVKGGYIFINIFIALFCVLGHIDSNKHIYRIFYFLLYCLSRYAKNPMSNGQWATIGQTRIRYKYRTQRKEKWPLIWLIWGKL